MSVYRFKIFGNDFEARVLRREQSEMVISLNGQEYKIYLEPSRERELAHPTPKLVRPPAVPDAGPQKTAVPGSVKAPLPGLVLRLLVAPGDTVTRGQSICVTESMKMENSIPSPFAGVVEQVFVQAGSSILEGQELVRIRAG